MPKARWETAPLDQDYAAAAVYLSLVLSPERSSELAHSLMQGPLVHHRANDLLRASTLDLLPAGDPEVVKDLKKVKHGKRLSPVLLVRGDLGLSHLTVADGYHRICASYHLDPDGLIPCRIGDFVR